jgi:hypothetical protein
MPTASARTNSSSAASSRNGVVGDTYGVVVILVPDHDHHRAENFLTSNGHLVGDVAEYGRPHVVANIEAFGLTGTTGGDLCTLGHTGIDEGLDAVELHARHDRAHLDALTVRVADGDLGRGGTSDRGRFIRAAPGMAILSRDPHPAPIGRI